MFAGCAVVEAVSIYLSLEAFHAQHSESLLPPKDDEKLGIVVSTYRSLEAVKP